MTGLDTVRSENTLPGAIEDSDSVVLADSVVPPDRSVRAIWHRAYADGWERGCEQGLAAVRSRMPRGITKEIDGRGPDQETTRDAYLRFVETVGTFGK